MLFFPCRFHAIIKLRFHDAKRKAHHSETARALSIWAFFCCPMSISQAKEGFLQEKDVTLCANNKTKYNKNHRSNKTLPQSPALL